MAGEHQPTSGAAVGSTCSGSCGPRWSSRGRPCCSGRCAHPPGVPDREGHGPRRPLPRAGRDAAPRSRMGQPGRLASIAIEATEQCGRITVPEIMPAQPLDQRLAHWPAGRRLYHADETGNGQPIVGALSAHGPGDLLVGPAGGFGLPSSRRCRPAMRWSRSASAPASCAPRPRRSQLWPAGRRFVA